MPAKNSAATGSTSTSQTSRALPTDANGMPDVGSVVDQSQASLEQMMGFQSAIQLSGMAAQVQTAAMNIMGQTVGATAAMAVQVVTDLCKTSKDAVKSQGEAFQKAN